MEKIDKILPERFNNVINDNKYISYNVTNDNNGDLLSNAGKYALDRQTFIPNTKETQLAETIASSLNDLQNYAFYLHVVNHYKEPIAYPKWREFQEEIKHKMGTPYEIGSPKKYFAWKFKKGLL